MYKIHFIVLALFFSQAASVEHFLSLDQALPKNIDVLSIAPVFDFDMDGCLPSSGISRGGMQNPGLDTKGVLHGFCRDESFLETSNTLHRHACTRKNGKIYCGHLFGLYFQKDQILPYIGLGHRHDWEYAAVFTKDHIITHATYSAHGRAITKEFPAHDSDQTTVRVVYHKDGLLTHAMRFANKDESAENPYGEFVTPPIVSWCELTGDNLTNRDMREKLNAFDYGKATIPVKAGQFIPNLNKAKPKEYPEFTPESVDVSSEVDIRSSCN